MRAGKSGLFRNTATLALTEVMTRGLSLVLLMAVARALGPTLMGIYAFGLTVIGIFEIFVNFGLEPYIQREIGRDPDHATQLFPSVFVLKGLVYLVCTAVVVGLAPVVGAESPKREVMALLLAAMFYRTNMTAVFAFFRARHQAWLEAVVRLSLRIIYTGVGIAIVFSGGGLILLVAAEMASLAIAAGLALFLFAKKIGRPVFWTPFDSVRRLAAQTWNFFLIRVVQTIFNSIDLVMLSLMAGDLYTGYYSAAVRLVGALGFIPAAFAGAFLPVLARHWPNSPDEFAGVLRPYFRFLYVLGTAIGAGIAGFSLYWTTLLFGNAFAPAAPTMAMTALALIVTFANWPLSMVIVAQNRESRMLRIFSICAVVNILLNLVAIPIWHDLGAATTTLVSQLVLLALQAHAVGNEVLLRAGLLKLAVGPTAAALAAYVTAVWLSRALVGIFAAVPCFCLVYLVVAVATGSISMADWSGLRSQLMKRTPKMEETK